MTKKLRKYYCREFFLDENESSSGKSARASPLVLTRNFSIDDVAQNDLR